MAVRALWLLVALALNTVDWRGTGPFPPEPVPAVIDRIEDGGWVVFLVGPSETEWVVPACLIGDGAAAGLLREGLHGYLAVRADGSPSFRPDPEGTAAAYRRSAEKLRLLRRRGGLTP